MPSRLRSLRCALTGAFALAGVAAPLLCSAATSVSQTSSAEVLSDTNWSTVLSVPQFNSSLGTLTSVVVTLNWNSYQAVSAVSADSSDQQVYAIDTVSVAATLQDGSTLTGGPPTMTVGSETPSDGFAIPTGDLPSDSTDSAGPTSKSGTVTSQTYTDATNLGKFTGSGTIGFTVAGNGSVNEVDSGGNITWSATTQAGASITLTYNYTPGGNNPGGCIQGAVIKNTAGDGRCDHPTETGLGAGVVIDVYNSAGAQVGTAKTASDGTFEVSGLLANTTYTVILVRTSLSAGYSLSSSYDYLSVNTPATGCVTGADFAAVQGNTSCGYNTFCQQDWQCTASCSQYTDCLHSCFSIVYPQGNCSLGGNQAGCTFTCPSGIEQCLVHNGPNCQLPRGCQTNPKSSCYLGQLVGETLCCKLNCDFSDAGIFCSGFKNLTVQYGQFRGCTVQQVGNAAQCYLNGNSSLPSVPRCSGDDLCQCLQQINQCCASSCGNGAGNGFCQ